MTSTTVSQNTRNPLVFQLNTEICTELLGNNHPGLGGGVKIGISLDSTCKNKRARPGHHS